MWLRKTLILINWLILISISSHAQNLLKGVIQEKGSGKKIEFASVSLFTFPDSSLLTAVATDSKGKFQMELPAGKYYLTCSFIGYQIFYTTITIESDKMTDVGTLSLEADKATLQDVTVLSKKSLLSSSIDRKVYNVEQDIMAQSGSVSDILRNVPSIDVDMDGNVSLRGSGSVLILINGRPSPLMGSSSADVLQQIPANTIERIEVITNPSARYKPDGTSGIINIVLKKNVKYGLNGNITASAGVRNRYNAAANLNYRPGKLNISSGISYRRDNRIRRNEVDRNDETISNNLYSEITTSNARPSSSLASLGFDYTINERNTIGLSGNTLYRTLTATDFTQRQYLDRSGNLGLGTNRSRASPEVEKEGDATVFWQHNFKKDGHEFRVEGNASVDNEKEDNRYKDETYFPLAAPYFENTLLHKKERQQNINADYSLPLKDDIEIEAGYEGNFSQVSADFYGEFFDTIQMKFLPDIGRSNDFRFKDFQHAVYTTFQKSGDKFGYALGLRAEQVFATGNLVTLGQRFTNNYFNLYPTLHLSYNIKESEIQLNYSRRINRPDGDELNPFPEYRDPRNLSAGNPNLKPEYISSVELGYKWQNKTFTIIPSLYYRYKKNGFTRVINKINDSTFLTTRANLSNETSSGLEVIVSVKTRTFFTANLSSNIFYNTINTTEGNYARSSSAISVSTNLTASFVITKSTFLQLSSNLRSARLTPQGKTAGNFVLNSGLRQDLFRKKISVILTAADVLKTLRQRTEINDLLFQQTTVNRRDAQVAYIGATFNFGNSQKKPKDENLQFDNSL